ncbi:MAG: phosphatase PAP2 family protein [Cyclobacteriaceae bacterium]|jgi:membrane-associated phospholipid phosphatase|nr:phosphatase PAP2 family protein [Cyclobacteriaceae bacterium]
MRLILLSILFISLNISKAQSSFPYKITKKDWLIAPISAATLITGQLLGKKDFNLNVEEIQDLNRQTINAFDRGATYNWSTSAQQFSDITEQTLRFAPLLYMIPIVKNKTWNNGVALGLMYAEVLMLNTGITGITKSLTKRIRPYLYNSSFTVEERFDFQGEEAPEAKTSFFSGHSSTAFASAVFLSKTFTDIYGKTTLSKVIWVGSLSLATATAIARFEAGVHFPTDVLAGAVVGSVIGYLIPVLHKSTKDKLSFSVFPNQIYVTYKLG